MLLEHRHFFLGTGLILGGGALYLTLSVSGAAPVSEARSVTVVEAPLPPPPAPGRTVAVAPAPDLGQLRLHGLTATGAIIASASGQRLVTLGREVVPGVTLEEVRQHHAVLGTASGRIELGFLGLAELPRSSESAATSEAPTAASSGTAGRRTETLQYRLGLEPRREGADTRGFAIRPGAEMPLLERAGLRAGDVLVAVNGQSFDSDEKVMELASEIAGSYTAEFEFERRGRRMKTSLPVNPRP